MSETGFRFVVEAEGRRLDRLVADATGRGRRAARRWIDEGLVRVNGHLAGAAETPRAGSEVSVSNDEFPGLPQAGLDVSVLHQGADWLAVAKPAGLHCERGKSPGSVAELLEARFDGLARVGDRAEEAGLVHRIDRDTSGVVLVARNRPAYLRLRAAFGRGEARKQYLALVAGRLGGCDVGLPLARRAGRMVAAGAHDKATFVRTRFEGLEAGDDWTLVLATMTTGAMHQVRVHAASIGHPLFGDVLYGGPPLPGRGRSGQLLHALRVRVGGDIDVSVGPPADFLETLALLRRSRP